MAAQLPLSLRTKILRVRASGVCFLVPAFPRYNQMKMIRFSTAGSRTGGADCAGLRAACRHSCRSRICEPRVMAASAGLRPGRRMKIETDKAHVLSGVRHGKTIGSPIAIEIVNRDWKNWKRNCPSRLATRRCTGGSLAAPGHADLAGALKFNFPTPAMFWNAPQPRVHGARGRRSLCPADAADTGD